jgi:hypothetical protein
MGDNVGEFVAIVTVPDPMRLPSTNGIWRYAGIMLEEGDVFTISASGAVNIWPNCEETKAEQGFPDFNCADATLGPNGTTVFGPAEDGYPVPGANVGALVAKIGSNGTPFLVGTGGTFVADRRGRLLVAINDTDFWSRDDVGVFSVVVAREPDGLTTFIPGTLDSWLPTGITLEAGQSITISASGILDIWPRCEIEKDGQGLSDIDCLLMRMGPTGTTGLDLAPDDYPLPGARTGALVARFGDGDVFLVGTGGTFTAPEGGELHFRINDIFGMGDNSGGYVAVMNINDAE